ncbi:MAG: hypothetical protein UY31_C0014G0003 [Candidatus Wolfebacteria bacterium GW2011_GWE1_48_7]|nr:MAG: hypothetical protein UX96_C0033G0010 [Candidatus Wolfebacteria bacterium GW2011_GWB1_47_243]KKU99948.1 MAG: hypothetical protein UY31_C0014G0003 [Candidatus Wolfebacteria bacterium GW2011_GWE1_48_7]
MHCIVKAERNWARRAENRNNFHYCLGLLLAGIGVVCMILGTMYIMSCSVTPVTVATIDDSWIRTMVGVRYDALWVGLSLLCLGTLLKWRAEDSQTTLEKTNCSVDYDILTARRSERR